jgi:general stress protein 26
MSEDLKREVFERFDGFPEIQLATAKGDQPKVRPVTLMHFDEKLYVATGTGSQKVEQIRGNPKTEFCLRLPEGEKIGYVRAAGTAEIVEDMDTRTSVANRCPFFEQFWQSPEDPTYTLIRLHVREIEYVRPGEMTSETFTL